jgi:hypothetical protein
MWVLRIVVLGALVLPVNFAWADDRNNAKKGALREKQDPSKDLKIQEENLKKLRINAEENKKVGNRAATWAANQDARHAEKLIAKDKKLLEEGKRSK